MFNKNIVRPVSTKRLRNMLRYFKNKNCFVNYEYNNSLGTHLVRDFKGVYDSFNIKKVVGLGYCAWTIQLLKNDKVMFEESFEEVAVFYGFGKIRENVSGPTSYFKIGHRSTCRDVVSKLMYWS